MLADDQNYEGAFPGKMLPFAESENSIKLFHDEDEEDEEACLFVYRSCWLSWEGALFCLEKYFCKKCSKGVLLRNL